VSDGADAQGSRGGGGDHLLPLAGGWTAWSWIWLRSAGFPADTVLALATERAAAAAARVGALEQAVDQRRRAAAAACEALLPDARGAASGALARALRRLAAGQPAEPSPDVPAPARAALEAAQAADAELAAARAALTDELARDTAAARRALQALLASGPMREALVWQNRRAVRGSVAGFLRRAPEDAGSKMREYDRLLATYAQRYCVKNETIGFFGPVGWADWSERPGLAVTPAPLARRTVYFEHWAVDLLARHLAAAPELRRHLAPRRNPAVRVDGETLHLSDGRALPLPVPFARLLAACDGETSAAELARRAASERAWQLDHADEALEALGELADKGLVTWTIELPTGDPRPERALRALLEGVPDRAASRPALDALDRLESARAEVAAAAGDADRLDGALASLERTFEELTGAAATRREGETYAGRGLVYEDCVLGSRIEVGADLRAALAEPLELLLQAARWYTSEIARRYRALMSEIHGELAGADGAVDLIRFRARLDPHLARSGAEAPPIVAEVARELRARWRRLLAPADGERQITRRAADLRPAAADLFAAPGPGWPGARYHSPDVLIAATGADAISRGDYQLVLGELHIAVNGFLTHVALEQHPDRDSLVRARERDLPDPGVAPVESREHATRADNCPVARHDLHVELGATRSIRPRSQVLAVADLVVRKDAGGLWVATRDGRRRFDAVAFFEQDLAFACINEFGVLGGARHTPRVTIDRLVVARERWRFDADELAFARRATPAERLAGAQAWREAHRLPRFLFARVPREPKPVYVDLSSALFVEILAKWARAGGAVTLSEMLPDHDRIWLPDTSGRRYSCELRLAVLDPLPWCPA